uniref:Uncharacterized protein n=1 Tax=Anguilla anguilla TaxID=7936 RepID=A0A0E9T768_ANGAN
MKYLALALLLRTQLHLLHGACFMPSLALSKGNPHYCK